MSCFVRAALSGGLVWILGGCAGPTDVSVPRGTFVRELGARVSPRERKLTFFSDEGAPGVAPQSMDSLTLSQDGTAGSGLLGTVELVTNSVGDTLAGDTCPGVSPGTKAFCGNVTLGHFFTRPLDHTFVQITSITDANGAPVPGHEGIGGDPSELGLDASLGLWKYTADASSSPGVLGSMPDNTGTRDWVFKNPDDADTYLGLRIVASLSYSGYAPSTNELPFVDACVEGTDLGPVSTAPVLLPFPFTLYDTTDQTVTINRRGVLALGATDLIAPARSVPLPASGNVPNCLQIRQCSVPRPAIFAFWDALLYNGGSACTLTSGTAPDRTFAVTWRHMARLAAEDIGADYTFTVVLHEGTNAIDFLYDTMAGPLPNAAGGSATVGVQDAAGLLATSETNTQNYGTGARLTLTPVP
jgi:hypothetical protein